MKEKVQAPELRFDGFTDDWEERKLSDLFIKGGSGGTPKSTNKAFYDGDIPFLGISDITKSNGFINNTEKHISSDGLNSSAAWIVSKGAISLAMYASVGKLAILNIDAATSQAFYNMIFDDYDLRDLVYQRLNKANELSEWNKLISTGTQSNLNADKVKNFQMYLPKKHDEIKLISTFFKQIDNTIALHQRKLDLLKEQKKGYLQKMFPKNGAKVPELRFAGFADDWEERKLGELSQDTFGGGTPKTSVTEYWNGEIPWIQSSDLSSDHLFGVLPKKHITENAVKNSATKLIPKNSIAIVTRVGVGKLAFMPYEFTSSQDFLSLSNLQVDCNFGMYSIYKMLQRELNNIQGTSIKGITKADLLDKEVIIPVEFEEQKKIGSFFKQLDNTIALHQRKLDLLKEQKKGFLQKMFV